jgi:dUTP pyrophosphatase
MKIKLLDPRAKVPTMGHPGEDLGYDLYALETIDLPKSLVMKVRTGIAIEFPKHYGAVIKDKSSLASEGVTVSGGVIDSGYRGEIFVLMTYHGAKDFPFDGYTILEGEKIAQLLLQPVCLAAHLEVVDDLSSSDRGDKGFGSTGR